MDKWPFVLITCGLLFGLAITITSMERQSVIDNWDKRRCEFPIMVASMFFKPEYDPRSNNAFAKDNFSFCTKSTVNSFMGIIMEPVNAIFESQLLLASNGATMINVLRNVTANIHKAFSNMLGDFYKKFNASVFEMSRIVQHLRMAMDRLGTITLSILFAGISAFRAMISAIQFAIKVILIICGIIIAIMIIIIFILFPFVPMILATLGVVVTTVALMSTVVVASLAGTAASDMSSSICFSKHTNIMCGGPKNVSEIKLGDTLDNCGNTVCGKVTTIIETSGKDVQLFDLNGIHVSASHLVKNGEEYNAVSDDPRSKKIEDKSDILYCFNTTSHDIPVYSEKGTIIFRDWDELSDNDKKGQYMWNYMMLTELNNYSNYVTWKDDLKIVEKSLMNRKVKTIRGFVNISEIRVLDKVLDRNGKEQDVIGIVKGLINGLINTEEWNTGLYEYRDNVWSKGKSTVLDGEGTLEGRTLITRTGEFIIWDKEEKLVRDFTEIGYDSIVETYSFVDSRLRLIK